VGDETASRRGHNYISLFFDLEAKRLVFSTEGRGAGTVGELARDLEAHGGSATELFEQPSREEGERFLKRWYFWATHFRLEPVIEVARTVKRHWEGILNWFEGKVTIGFLEGINSLIQAGQGPGQRVSEPAEPNRHGISFGGQAGLRATHMKQRGTLKTN